MLFISRSIQTCTARTSRRLGPPVRAAMSTTMKQQQHSSWPGWCFVHQLNILKYLRSCNRLVCLTFCDGQQGCEYKGTGATWYFAPWTPKCGTFGSAEEDKLFACLSVSGRCLSSWSSRQLERTMTTATPRSTDSVRGPLHMSCILVERPRIASAANLTGRVGRRAESCH